MAEVDADVTRAELPVVVIAAAGRARRFAGEQKVLAEVGGVPAICRVAQACQEGIGPHRQLVVIGHMGGEVRAALGETPLREYVHQQPQLGTGHALMVALERLNGHRSREVYFLCGDKPLISPDSLRRLRERLLPGPAGMVFMTSELDGDPLASRQGRVVQVSPTESHAEVMAIVERAAIDALGNGDRMTFQSSDGRWHKFAREQLLAVREVNASAYGWRLDALLKSVGELPLHRDSWEYYITDLVEILRRHGLSVQAVPLRNGHESIGIDTKELLETAKRAWEDSRVTGSSVHGRRDVRHHASGIRCSELLGVLDRGDAEVRRSLARAYGSGGAGLMEDRRLAYRQAVWQFLKCFGDKRVRVFRAPGRIALNPHCEHQGAWVPYGTHRREIVFVVSPRRDDVFVLSNTDQSHQEKLSFRLRDEIGLAAEAWRRGWADYIEDGLVAAQRDGLADPKQRVHGKTGSINFIKAAALRLAREAGGRVRGAEIVISGDIPQGVGQSSSSALVVGAACALNCFWGLGLAPETLAAICGEAEWYMGTRGGAGDHAAMLLGSHAGLTDIRFEPPVKVRETRPMCIPPEYRLLIVDSLQRAIKSKEERRPFNAGIFAYRFALRYLQEALRRQAGGLGLTAEQAEARFLADISVERLPLEAIYRLLLEVPELVTPQELLDRYPTAYGPAALSCFGSADPEQLPASIPVRGAALYGLGRVDRGLVMHELCARGDEAAMQEFGRLMCATHDGDRVTRYDPHERRSVPYRGNLLSVTDARIQALIEAAVRGSGSSAWDSAQLRCQCGFYGASIAELDKIVDLAVPLPGVLGAGLMGAGGGGCVLVLAKAGEETLARVTETLAEEYYRPMGQPPAIEQWHPTPPAGEVGIAPGAGDHLAVEVGATWSLAGRAASYAPSA